LYYTGIEKETSAYGEFRSRSVLNQFVPCAVCIKGYHISTFPPEAREHLSHIMHG